MSEVDNLKKLGFNILPLQPKSKKPIEGENWTKFQHEQYIGSYPQSCNLAVILGETSGDIFVVDLDDKSLYTELPARMLETYTVRTGKGYHLYYRYKGFPPPQKKMDDKRGRHIDIKSQGGYVLAPSSIHPDTGQPYEVINDSPIKTMKIEDLKEYLTKMGFNVDTKSIEEIEKGVSKGGRDDATFKYACDLIRNHGLFGEPLRLKIDELNARHNPPLSESDIKRIISSAIKSESRSIVKNVTDARTVLEQLSNAPQKITMQDITPKYEGKPIEFDCMVIAVGERMTYTVEADAYCAICQKTQRIQCDENNFLDVPYCPKHKRSFEISDLGKKTAYIQQLRIQEFVEDARNSSPIQFDAEITDEDVGEAYIGDRKTIVAKFRSRAKPKSQYNIIVFQILEMKDLEQKEGCLPTPEEVAKWKKIDIFSRVTESIVPDIYMNPMILQSLILWGCGGNSLNGKRDLIHMAILGDAQLGKTELMLKMNKILIGSGHTVGRNVSGAGLTIAMVKMYNGTMIPEAGFFPIHTGHPCIIDEIDKMEKKDHDSCLEVMENQTTSQAKAGSHGGMKLPAVCPLLVAGNPKNGKFNPKYPSVMDNFDMEAPFISRFDLLWMLIDANDPEQDILIRKFIRSYDSRKEQYMKLDELQRYFEYIRTLTATIPQEMMDKVDELHKKMRPLNIDSGVPIGLRQYHGLYRLLTASAKAHLRDVVNDTDFEIVEKIISESYKSMKMDLETGEVKDTGIKTKDTKLKIILEVWKLCMNEDNTVDREEYISELVKTGRFNALDAPTEFEKIPKVLDNDTERWKYIG